MKLGSKMGPILIEKNAKSQFCEFQETMKNFGYYLPELTDFSY